MGLSGFLGLLIWLAWPIPFLSDDWRLVEPGGLDLGRLFTTDWHGVAGQGGFYRPLVRLSLQLNLLLFGLEPGTYHLVNVLLHGANALLVAWLHRELFSSPKAPEIEALGDDWAPLASAALFLVLPVHTDGLFWVAGRTDTLCAVFFLLAVILFCRNLDSPNPLRIGGMLICTWGALLSKEMAWSLPGVLLAVALYKRGLRLRRTWIAVVLVLLSLLLYFLIRWHYLGTLLSGPANLHFTPGRVWASLRAIAALLFGTGLPGFGLVVLLASAGIAAVSIFRDRKRELVKPLVLLLGVMALMLVPLLGLITRWYLYIPSVFACLLVSRLMVTAGRDRLERWFVVAMFAGLVTYLGASLVQEGLRWRRAGRLGEQTLSALLAMPQLRQPGRLLLVNVPSALWPRGSIGEKPVFAYNLPRALRLSSGHRPRAEVLVVNHLLLREEGRRVVSLRQARGGALLVTVDRGRDAWFSFHTPEFISGRRRPEQTTLIRDWGRLRLVHPRRLAIFPRPRPGDRILIFDGVTWSAVNEAR